MPNYLRGQERNTLTFVKVTIGNLYYGFKTKNLTAIGSISQADLTALGHIAYQNLRSSAIPIFGANAPKPPRVKKQLVKNPSPSQHGAVSTFCGIDNLSAAQAQGWEVVSLTTPYRLRNDNRAITVAANFANGGLYLFAMNRADAETFGLELGLAFPNQLTVNFYYKRFGFVGTSKPRPPIVSKQTPQGRFTCFCSPITLQEALTDGGYSLVKPEVKLENPNTVIF